MRTSQEVNDAIDSLERTALKIKRDRDELLAALKEIVPLAVAAIAFVDCKATVNRASAAIARAESDFE